MAGADISLTVSPMRDLQGRIIGPRKSRATSPSAAALKKPSAYRIDRNSSSHQEHAGDSSGHRHTNAAARRDAGRFRRQLQRTDQALARAHALLTGSSFQSAKSPTIWCASNCCSAAEDHRISQSAGADIEAQPDLHLALVLHELGTNARKHGALSVVGGLGFVRWRSPIRSDGPAPD